MVLSARIVVGLHHSHPLNNKFRVINFFNVLNSYFVYFILNLDMHLSFKKIIIIKSWGIDSIADALTNSLNL